MINWKEVSDSLIYLLSVVIIVLGYFLKSIHSEHKKLIVEQNDLTVKYESQQTSNLQMKNSLDELKKSVEKLGDTIAFKKDLEEIKEQSTNYWKRHQQTLESHERLMLEKFRHMEETNKLLIDNITDKFEKIDSILDKMVDKLDTKVDKK